MRISVLAFSVKPLKGSSNSTPRRVVEALRESGHDASLLCIEPNMMGSVAALAESKTELIFNLARSAVPDGRIDASIAGLLEMLELPFTGSAAQGILMCRDRLVVTEMLRASGAPAPRFFEVSIGSRIDPANFKFPVIVRPRFANLKYRETAVSRIKHANERAIEVHRRFQQAAMCEESIEGRDICVYLLGNERMVIFPAAEPVTVGTVRNNGGNNRWMQATDLSSKARRRIGAHARTIKQRLELRDYCRIDFRVTPEDRLFVIDAEPQPDLISFAEVSSWSGVSFPKLLEQICRLAVGRSKNG